MGNITHQLTIEILGKQEEVKKPKSRSTTITKLFKSHRKRVIEKSGDEQGKDSNPISSLSCVSYGLDLESQKEVYLVNSHQHNISSFSFETLISATNNFDPSRLLGEGGFGSVYKGKLKDGSEIAVKKLNHESFQGEEEFLKEVNLLLQVRHRNCVKLLGYCVHGVEKLLVYEFAANGSLGFLFGKDDPKYGIRGWKIRYGVIVGVARGVFYLHEDCPNRIIHRDIKPGNILLDSNWVPKITDFGISLLFPDDMAYLDVPVCGTPGYAAPEYLATGRLTEKADIYAYGVLVLEIISGRRSIEPNNSKACNLIVDTLKLGKRGKCMDIMDSKLASENDIDTDEVTKCIKIGLLCTQNDPSLRPSMRDVLMMLWEKPNNTHQEPNGHDYPISHSPGSAFSSMTSSAYSCFHSTFASTSNINSVATSIYTTTKLHSHGKSQNKGCFP